MQPIPHAPGYYYADGAIYSAKYRELRRIQPESNGRRQRVTLRIAGRSVKVDLDDLAAIVDWELPAMWIRRAA